MQGNSRTIDTQQQGIHENLAAIVKKYQSTQNQRPVSAHTETAYQDAIQWLGDWRGEVIIDSCCGVGKSTATIAQQFPNAKVIGIDKSALRVGKHHHYQGQTDNYRLIRADVLDFWRLLNQNMASCAWTISHHFLLYPNPYPKASQVQKRWHASPVMPDLMALSAHIEVRSNWLIYLQEFAQAALAYDFTCDIKAIPSHSQALTPFEQKYINSGQTCWQLVGKKQRG